MVGSALRRIALLAVLLGPAVAAGSAIAAAQGITAGANEALRCAGLPVPAEREAACTAYLARPGIAAKDTALAYYNRGFSRLDLHRDDAAVLDFSVAIGFDADLWPARWVRAELKGRQRHYDEAAADWAEIIRHAPPIASLHANRGEALDNAGHSDEAFAEASQAITMAGPKDPLPQYYLDRALSAESLHQWAKALADYGEVIQRNGDLEHAYAGRGRVAFLTGDFAAAVADLKKAADIEGADGYGMLWLYVAELRAGVPGKEAASGLRTRSQKFDLKRWPGPIIEIVLGDRRPEALPLPSAPTSWPDSVRKAAGQCEMSFYLAEAGLARGERDHAAALLRASVDSGIREFIEYRAATVELQRIAK